MSDNSIIDDLLTELNKHATSAKAYLQGDHAQHTWGATVPYLSPQWLIGGSNVLPCQRYFGFSGEEKSFKSTLAIEFGNWFILQNGVHIHLDTENKTSPTMLDAMTWWNGIGELRRRVFKVCASIGEWQMMTTKTVESARKMGPKPVNQRIPLFVTVDSLMARSTEDADRELRKEGAAAERAFPVSSLQVTNFLETLNLLGTTCAVGWVQHMKESMDQTTGYSKQYKEKGAKAAQFSCSTHLRVSKGAAFRVAKDDSAPFPGIAVEGYDIYMKTARSCLGPGDRTLKVRLCWQQVPQEDGTQRQAMWFDWHGALGEVLCRMLYDENFKPKLFKEDKARLREALRFTQKAANSVKCEELGLDGASFYAFGKAIDDNIDVRDKLSKFLNITEYASVQEADIDYAAGSLGEKKKKKGK